MSGLTKLIFALFQPLLQVSNILGQALLIFAVGLDRLFLLFYRFLILFFNGLDLVIDVFLHASVLIFCTQLFYFLSEISVFLFLF